MTNVTVGAGMILDRHASELLQTEQARVQSRQALLNAVQSQVTQADRQERYAHGAATVWLTGLPRSGKSTIAYELEKRLWGLNCAVHVLDGVNMRLGLSKDLGFSADDRSESSRRAAETARLFNDAGMLTIAAFVSPYGADRERARERIGDDRFMEVWLKTSVEECERRDAQLHPDGQGLFARAQAGKIKNFTGVSAPYEEPTQAALIIDTETTQPDDAVDAIVDLLRARGLLAPESQ
jgi:adenylyl-sulfate kinase